MKPYIVKNITLVQASGNHIPLNVSQSKPLRLTDFQLKHIIRERFRNLSDPVVEVRYTKEPFNCFAEPKKHR